MSFKPQPVSRARDQVERQLREAILSGTFTRGEKLPSEAELASDFAVSRTTVREALRSLAATGLISKVPGATGGSFVKIVDYRSLAGSLGESMEDTLRLGAIDYNEVTSVRRFLEIPSARLASMNRTESDVERLTQIVDRQKGITVEDPQVPQLDVNFHSAVADASKNRVLAAFISALHRVTRPVLAMDLSPEVGKNTVRQHSSVVKAIADSDPEAAASAMQEHLDYLHKLQEERVSSDGSPRKNTGPQA